MCFFTVVAHLDHAYIKCFFFFQTVNGLCDNSSIVSQQLLDNLTKVTTRVVTVAEHFDNGYAFCLNSYWTS